MSWFDGVDDPELLQAALASLDAWDVSGDALCGDISVVSLVAAEETTDFSGLETSPNATDSSSSDGDYSQPVQGTLEVEAAAKDAVVGGGRKARPATVPRQLKPSTLASTTHKRQNEIVYLRDKIAELQQQLASLQSKHEESAAANTTGIDQEVTVMWQSIANRQQRMRHKAELEQVRLRRLLEMQVNVSQQLLQAFQTVRQIENDAALPTPKRQKLIRVQKPMCQRERDQLAELDARYHQIHSQFTLPKFNNGTLQFLDIQVTDESDGSVIIQFDDAKTVPFESTKVLAALWKDTIRALDKKWDNMPDTHAESVQGDDVHIVRFSISGSTPSEGQITAKQFHGNADHPPAIVAMTQGTPLPNRDRGIFFDEDVWLRIIPAPSHASHSSRSYPLTLVQSIRRFRFAFEDAASAKPGDPERVGFVTNLVLDKLKADVESKHEVLEMLLLQPRPEDYRLYTPSTT